MGHLPCHGRRVRAWLAVQHRAVLHHGGPYRDHELTHGTARGPDFLQQSR